MLYIDNYYMRDNKSRYTKKKQNIIIDIPSLSSLIKYSIIIFIFASWIYTLIFEFNMISILEEFLSYLFGPKNISQFSDYKGKETPY